MQIDFAILADYVQENGGKLYVIGGGIDRIFAQGVPCVHPNLGFAARLEVTPAEQNRQHEIEFIISNADGGRVAKLDGKIQPQQRPEGGMKGMRLKPLLAINLPNVQFKEFGSYQIEVVVNNTSIKQIPFSVDKFPQQLPTP